MNAAPTTNVRASLIGPVGSPLPPTFNAICIANRTMTMPNKNTPKKNINLRREPTSNALNEAAPKNNMNAASPTVMTASLIPDATSPLSLFHIKNIPVNINKKNPSLKANIMTSLNGIILLNIAPTIIITAATATNAIYCLIPSETSEPDCIYLDANMNTAAIPARNSINIPTNISMPLKSICLARSPTIRSTIPTAHNANMTFAISPKFSIATRILSLSMPLPTATASDEAFPILFSCFENSSKLGFIPVNLSTFSNIDDNAPSFFVIIDNSSIDSLFSGARLKFLNESRSFSKSPPPETSISISSFFPFPSVVILSTAELRLLLIFDNRFGRSLKNSLFLSVNKPPNKFDLRLSVLFFDDLPVNDLLPLPMITSRFLDIVVNIPKRPLFPGLGAP